MFGRNTKKSISASAARKDNSQEDLTVVIPKRIVNKYNFDSPGGIMIDCVKDGVLIRKLDLFP